MMIYVVKKDVQMINQKSCKLQQQVQMISLSSVQEEAPQMVTKTTTKKQRNGRWTTPEIYLFESLLQRFGKNWKKIHQYMKGRSLSQIRSHAQKYFSKLGARKVEEYERRAKLIEAYEIIEKEKRLQDQKNNENMGSNSAEQVLVKRQEEILETIQQESKESTKMNEVLPKDKSSEIIKEQVKQSQQIQKQKVFVQEQNPSYMAYLPQNQGFLISLIQLFPQNYKQYGISGFIDNGAFNQVHYQQ